MSTQFEYQTTIHGGIVSVWLNVDRGEDEEGKYTRTFFNGVFLDGTEVTSILTNEQISELEMEAEKGFAESEWESSNGY